MRTHFSIPTARSILSGVLAASALIALTGCEYLGFQAKDPTGESTYGGRGVYKIFVADYTDKGEVIGTGTGFLINDKNLVVTNRHVATRQTDKGWVPWPRIKIMYIKDGQLELVDAKVIEVRDGPFRDLTLLQPAKKLPGTPVQLAGYDAEPTSLVTAVGYPGAADFLLSSKVRAGVQQALGIDLANKKLKSDKPDPAGIIMDYYEKEMQTQFRLSPSSFSPTVTEGKVSRVSPYESVPVIQHQASINGGNSGGPLFDACGAVVGVNTFGPPQGYNSQGINMSLASPWVIEQVKAAGHEARVTSPCLTARLGPYMPIAIGGTAFMSLIALLTTITLLVFFRKTPVVQRGYTMITRVGRPVAAGGAGQATRIGGTNMATPARAGRGSVDATVMPGASVMQPQAAAGGALRLVPVNGGAPLSVGLDRLSRGATIGRESGNDLISQDKTISKRHARLTLDRDNRLVVEDLNSANGTFKGRSKITRDTFARGETVKFGSAEYRVELPGSGGAAGGTVAATAMQSPGMQSAAGGPERSLMLSGMDLDGRPIQLSLRASGERSWTVGRKAGVADLVIGHPRISGEHARIRYRPGRGFEISDLKSQNGTTVDNVKIGSEFVALDGAKTVMFGDLMLDINRG